MEYRNMETVEIAGKVYPIKCDINVLMVLQDEFENLMEFETLLTGMWPVKNPDGSIVRKEDGTILFEWKEPSVRAVYKALPLMLREAADELKGVDAVDLAGTDEAIRDAQFDLYKTANAIHAEFSKCFERKNVSSARGEETQEGKQGLTSGG